MVKRTRGVLPPPSPPAPDRGSCGGGKTPRFNELEATRLNMKQARTLAYGDALKLCRAMPADAELLAHIKKAVPGLTRFNTALMVAKAVLEKFGSRRVASEVK